MRNFASRNLIPTIGAEVDNVEFGKRFALQSKGLALMFHPYVAEEVAQGRLVIIPVANKELRLGIDVVTNQEAPISPLLRSFLDLVEKHFGYPLDYPRDEREPAFPSLQNLFLT